MVDRESQQGYWDKNLDAQNLGAAQSDSPESLLDELKFSSVPDIQEMIAHLHPAPGRRILEIGCGLGANAVLLRNAGATVIALDISHERLTAMKSRTRQLPSSSEGKIIAVKARAEALPFRDKCLDGSCSRAVIIHTDIPRVCEEVARTMKADAPFAFSEPMAHNPLVNIYRRTLAPKEWRGITSYFTDNHVYQIAGYFTNVCARKYYALAFMAFVFQYAISSPALFYKTLEITTSVDSRITRRWPRFGRYAWFVLITGKSRAE